MIRRWILCWHLLAAATVGAQTTTVWHWNNTRVTDPDDNTTSLPVIHFKLGFLAPWNGTYDQFSALTSASAVSIALDRLQNDLSLRTLADRLTFSVVTMDSGCNSKQAASNAVKLHIEENVDAFIGPPCSVACRPVAQLASFWNKPIISWVATDPDFDDNIMYSTLARSLGPLKKIGAYLIEIFEQYSWHVAVVISSDNYTWGDAGKAVREVFDENNITIAYSSEYLGELGDDYIVRTLTKLQFAGRVVVLVMPKKDRRRFMLAAHDLGMTTGEYVFFTLEIMPEENVLNSEHLLSPEYVWQTGDHRDHDAKEAFEAVFYITLAGIAGKEAELFRKDTVARLREEPWISYVPAHINMDDYYYSDKYAPYLFDAVVLYAIALNKTLAEGQDIRSGIEVIGNMRGKFFKGMSGNVVLDLYGDREPDYWVTDMLPNGSFIRIAEVLNTDKFQRAFHKDILPPRWPGGRIGHQYAPPDVPKCGFRGEHCIERTVKAWLMILMVVLSITFVSAVTGIGVYIFKKRILRSEFSHQSWRVLWEDIVPYRKGNDSMLISNPQEAHKDTHLTGPHESRAFCESNSSCGSVLSQSPKLYNRRLRPAGVERGIYKGAVVTIKPFLKEHVQASPGLHLEFRQMKAVVNENINVFVGACVDPPNLCLFWHYCPKGSVQEVLLNDNIKLDQTFKLSFMIDIAKGLEHLHKTPLHSHGNLKSSNCLIDNRWTVKITDFGLPSYIACQEMTDENKLWTAPEMLREIFPPPRGTQRGDVYSFAIVCAEIMMRGEPYNLDNITARDVVTRVRSGESNPTRPVIQVTTDLELPLVNLIKKCWSEDASERPTFDQIRDNLHKMTDGDFSIMDNVLQRMEKYTNNLEQIVQDRTHQLMEEKRTADRLLSRMLPQTVAEQLKVGKLVHPENFDESTIYFSDIEGFTTLAADSSPMQIVDFLNDLYSCFDDTIKNHDVYKVETIGDAYMVVSGVPVRNNHKHVTEITNCALDLLSAVTHFKIKHRPHHQLNIRIGLHTGPVVAGVVGNVMPRYCLFGDTVTMTMQMEANGQPLRIHISEATHVALTDSGGGYLATRRRTDISIKVGGWYRRKYLPPHIITPQDKGLQTTYWLHGKVGYDKPLPLFTENASGIATNMDNKIILVSGVDSDDETIIL